MFYLLSQDKLSLHQPPFAKVPLPRSGKVQVRVEETGDMLALLLLLVATDMRITMMTVKATSNHNNFQTGR